MSFTSIISLITEGFLIYSPLTSSTLLIFACSSSTSIVEGNGRFSTAVYEEDAAIDDVGVVSYYSVLSSRIV